jgi:cell division protease FtsH
MSSGAWGPKKEIFKMNLSYKSIFVLIIIGFMLFMQFRGFNKPGNSASIDYSDFLKMVESESVTQVTLQGGDITGSTAQGAFHTFAPKDSGLITLLKNKGVKIRVKPENGKGWFRMILSWVPMLLMIGVWIFFMRRMQGGGGNLLSFGKNKASLVSDALKKVTFEDVAGIDEARDELQEIVDFLKDPGKFTRLGGRIPKGVLLVGAPGTGKTLLARAIAGVADVPFFTMSGSDFVEMFVGIGASRVRDLFKQGKKNAPCIIFVDEIDAVGRQRGAGLGGGHDEKEQTLNQLLVEMDGFEPNEGVILIAATNRPDVLDPALLRPGRFDRQVEVSVPDITGRLGILKVHVRENPLANDVDLKVLARGTPGFTGADIENMVNEAALMAARRGKNQLEMVDLEDAKDKVMMGPERQSMIISEAGKKAMAYHEAGHTIVARLLPGTDPIHKVTIIPRGRSLGLTQQLPMVERHTYPKDDLQNRISILMAGRAAEEIIFDTQSTGTGNDIRKVSELARKMVCEYGMSKELGPLAFGKKEEPVFLGKALGRHSDYSRMTAQKIDEEVRGIVVQAYKKALALIKDNLDTLGNIAVALLEKETLNRRDIDELMAVGETPVPKKQIQT